MLKQLVRRLVPSFGYDLPPRQFFTSMLEASKFTPDIAKLELYEWQLLFAPDELKRDHYKHSLLGTEAQYKFPAFTQASYHFWDPPEAWNSPVPLKVEGFRNALPFFPPIAKIKGEVHMIRPQQLWKELDPYRQNTIEYQRERVRLIVPYRYVKFIKDHSIDPEFLREGAYDHRLDTEEKPVSLASQMNTTTINYQGSSVKTSEERVAILRAWMYIGIPQYWDPLINGYDYGHVESFHSKNRKWCDTYYNIRRPPLPPK